MLSAQQSRDLAELIRIERRAFAAKLRMARAVLGWSQGELGDRVGLTQRAIHKLEQGETEPRRSTILAIERIWSIEGIAFEDSADGGFRVMVSAPLVDRPVGLRERRKQTVRHQLGVTALAPTH